MLSLKGVKDAKKTPILLPGIPVHIVQRGHSREPVFFESDDYHAFLHWLGEHLSVINVIFMHMY